MSRTRADLLASYRSYLALQRDLSGHTVRAYLVDISDLLSFLGVGEGDAEPVDAALATLDLADLRDWLAAMAASGHSRATLARRSASVRTFSSWAFEAGLLTSDVAARLRAPRVDNRLPGVLTPQQASQLLKTASDLASDGPRLCPSTRVSATPSPLTTSASDHYLRRTDNRHLDSTHNLTTRITNS